MADRGTNYRIFSPEIWSDFIKVYFKDALYAAKFFKNFSSDLQAQGGDMITIPNLSRGPTPITLTTTTGALTDYVITETRTQLSVDAWIAQSKYFSDFELSRIKGNYGLEQRYLKESIVPELANNFDTKLIGQSGQSSNVQLHTGTSAVMINNTTITEAIRIADSVSLPLSELSFFFHPNTYWAELFRRTQLIDASQFGKPLMASESIRPLGYLYGIPCFVTNLVGVCTGVGGDGYPQTVHRNLLIHPRAIAYAYGRLTPDGPRMGRERVGGALANRVFADLMYGTAAPGKANEGIRIIGTK